MVLERGGEAGVERCAHVGFVGGKEQVGAQGLQVVIGRPPVREDAAFELQAHVGGIVLVLEDLIIFLKIEQRARRVRDDELTFEAGEHPNSPPGQTHHCSPRLQAASR
ncbi:MAG: hypothetical protein A2040_05675 [Rhodocyclales bacterium GWA2_65_19]|nr:MAG: hypothetical protein A2040_05675 [Rhodocyclales bacterium GWA2_65_19]